jgi:3-oxoacyl-[acyl-carrier protein] reductase
LQRILHNDRYQESINIGSAASRLNSANGGVYTATKAAVDSLTRVLAKELGPKRIRMNSVNPGFMATDGTSDSIGSDLVNGFIANTPLGRAAEPPDIAAVAVFLASDDARWLTGELLFAGGGLCG